MALSHKAKKRWALVILIFGLPVYIVMAVTIMSGFRGLFGVETTPIWLELLVYIGLGVAWAFPLKKVFMGVGQPDPNEPH